jgi:hypothetical protein
MRLNRQFAVILLAGLAGCSSPGMLVSRQSGDAVPVMGKTPADGMYGLFIAGEDQPLYELYLKKDQPIGFDRGEEGIVRWLYAEGGPSRNRLDVTRSYEWRLLPTEPGTGESGKTSGK